MGGGGEELKGPDLGHGVNASALAEGGTLLGHFEKTSGAVGGSTPSSSACSR